MPEAWDIVCMTYSHRIMELGALWCQAPVSGNMAHCSVPCRVSYWVSRASLAQPKQAVFHGPTPEHWANASGRLPQVTRAHMVSGDSNSSPHTYPASSVPTPILPALPTHFCLRSADAYRAASHDGQSKGKSSAQREGPKATPTLCLPFLLLGPWMLWGPVPDEAMVKRKDFSPLSRTS